MRERVLRIVPGSVVVTVASAATGHADWVARHFTPDQILALDECRRLVSGSADEHTATVEAFELLVRALDGRARRGITTAVDGAFFDPAFRRRLVEVARRHARPAIAACFRLPEERAQFRSRAGRRYTPGKLLKRQLEQVEAFVRAAASAADVDAIHPEGWDRVVVFDDVDADLLPVVRYTLPEALPVAGPFDVIGDVHGCLGELDTLLDRLGWLPADADGARRHPAGRVAAFVGDYADRGPDSAGVFRRVMAMHAAGTALGVPGNHCVKLLKWFQGRRVQVANGLDLTLAQLRAEGPAFEEAVQRFLEALPPVLPLDGGHLVVFHAALPRDRVGRRDESTRAQLAYGVVQGTDEAGYPIRDPAWTATWKAGEEEPLAVYGHTPVPEPERRSNTLDIDGGCVFGGYLAAFRWPERTLVCVPAAEVHFPSPRVTWRGPPPG